MITSHRGVVPRSALVPVLFSSAAALLFHGSLGAQQAGHYVGGATGLENGTAPPPGAYAIYFPYVNRIDGHLSCP